jgi:hypothetical protein
MVQLVAGKRAASLTIWLDQREGKFARQENSGTVEHRSKASVHEKRYVVQ